MTSTKVQPADVAIPLPVFEDGPGEVFRLSSHERAREALKLALGIPGPNFNAFVLGEDRCARMSMTLGYLRSRPAAADRPASDWLYLANFWMQREPYAFALESGEGRRFQERLSHYLRRLRSAMGNELEASSYRDHIDHLQGQARDETAQARDAFTARVKESGFDLQRDGEKLSLVDPADATGLGVARREQLEAALVTLEHENSARLSALEQKIEDFQRDKLAAMIAAESVSFIEPFQSHAELRDWIDDLNTDLLDHTQSLIASVRRGEDAWPARYRANLLIDQTDNVGPLVILEPNPTYENLFGYIEYRRGEMGSETDHTMIRPGALHRANGGILVLRAEALADDDSAWRFLKAALRDGVIRIEELHRTGSMPMSGSPRPYPIPLNVKIVIVGSPDTYYRHFSTDPEFRTYFKVKAEIDPDMPATKSNLAVMARILRQEAEELGSQCEDDAVSFLLGLASRWASRRDLLTARIESFGDLLREAHYLTQPLNIITRNVLYSAWQARRRRNSRAEERFLENMKRGYVTISTTGRAIGQINALTVRDLGDQAFGRPSRVTARASAGRRGLINIERIVDLGGKSQQKGVLVVEGYLRGRFGRQHSISFDCSLTFEQNYGGVDGDSASIAELVAVISALAQSPVRQDIAVTGSFNQLGQVQAVGDVIEKVEGFFQATRASHARGEKSGVILPLANVADLVLENDVVSAMARGDFHIWGVSTVDEASALLFADAFGSICDLGEIHQLVEAELGRFNDSISQSLFPPADYPPSHHDGSH